jgi:xanthine dehydrogenase FAD-binding subunit
VDEAQTTGNIETQPITDWHRPLRDADFLTASTIEEALAMVNENPDARFIAGGTTLVRMERWGGNLPSTLIYIGQIEEMQQVREEGGRLVLGALVVHDRLRQAVAHRAGAGLLWSAAQEIAGPAVRNLATIGGNVYIDWDMVPSLMALDAQVHVREQNGDRWIPLADFYDRTGNPKMSPKQLITEVSIATDLPLQAYQKIARRRALSRAIVGAAVAMAVDGEACREIRIGLGGAGLRSRRLTDAEALLSGNPISDDLVQEAGEAAFESAADALEDMEAKPWYTRDMARVMVERAINAAAGRPVL